MEEAQAGPGVEEGAAEEGATLAAGKPSKPASGLAEEGPRPQRLLGAVQCGSAATASAEQVGRSRRHAQQRQPRAGLRQLPPAGAGARQLPGTGLQLPPGWPQPQAAPLDLGSLTSADLLQLAADHNAQQELEPPPDPEVRWVLTEPGLLPQPCDTLLARGMCGNRRSLHG